MPQPDVGQRGHLGHVEISSLCSLLGRLDAAAVPTGLDGGEADHGEDIAGEGAGLALGFGEAPAPSLQGGAHTRSPAGRFQLRPLSWALVIAEVARRMVAMLAPALARAARYGPR